MTIVLGLIGDPCSGKSTVAESLAERGGVWLNADAIAKEQASRPEIVKQLVHRFGASILDKTQRIDRAALANLVFGTDIQSRQRLLDLEAMVHPPTRQEIWLRLCDAIDAKRQMVILDIPLLLESGWDFLCDEVWFVQVSPERQAQLVQTRGWTAEELNRRRARQLPTWQKKSRCTRTLTNDADLPHLRAIVDDAFLKTCRMALDPGPHCRPQPVDRARFRFDRRDRILPKD